MAVDSILNAWKKNKFQSVYWLEGDEPFFIDQVIHYAERNILNEAETSFNLNVFYGKDADMGQVLSTCRKYPMFSDRQVVVIKEAQHIKDKELEKLESYILNPLASTILVVGYKEKKLDGRKKMAKIIKEAGTLVTTKKMYDNQLPDWVKSYALSLGFSFAGRAADLLVEHIGNDLSRLNNEIQKILPNLKQVNRTDITDDDIEKYVGISKEYNVFELQHAITQRNLTRCIQIIQYFEANPKAVPVQMLLPALYSFFSKAYLIFGLGTNNEYQLAQELGYKSLSPYVKDIITCAKNYRQRGVEHAILIMHEYNLKSLGINAPRSLSSSGMLKEMIVKIMNSGQ